MPATDKLLDSDVISLQVIKDVCKNVLKDSPDVSCYLFGSYAKGTPKRTSDIDLLLFFDQDTHSYQAIFEIEEQLRERFLKIDKFCNPIHSYKNSINSDNGILFRQYVLYGSLLTGPDVTPLMKKESMEELNKLEYAHYWMPMYRKKIETLEWMMQSKMDTKESTVAWQYLFLIAYWFAKAQLTPVHKQNSLNRFSLEYIYEKLMEKQLDKHQRKALTILQKQRDDFQSGRYFSKTDISFEDCFTIVKDLVQTMEDSHNIKNDFI